jgi:hypothetical protein
MNARRSVKNSNVRFFRLLTWLKLKSTNLDPFHLIEYPECSTLGTIALLSTLQQAYSWLISMQDLPALTINFLRATIQQ